jgi:membrane protein
VRFRHAFFGAVLAVPLWAAAEKGFAIYIKGLVAKGSLYGTLGLIPLFLIWLNVCWLIFLTCGQWAYVWGKLDVLERRAAASRIVLGAWDVLAGAVAMAQRFGAGGGPVPREHLSEAMRISEVETQVLLDRLCAGNIVCPIQGDEERYALARPAERIPIRDVLLAGVRASPGEAVPSSAAAKTPPANHARWAPAVAAAVAHVETRTEELLAQLTLADVVRESLEKTDEPPKA